MRFPVGAGNDVLAGYRFILILQQAFKIGLDAAVVHHCACGSIHGHVTYGETVLDYVVPCLKVLEDYLMASWNILEQSHALYHLTFGKVFKGYRYVVRRINFYIFHNFSFKIPDQVGDDEG